MNCDLIQNVTQSITSSSTQDFK